MTCGTLVIHTASSGCCLKALCVAVLRTNIVDDAITNTLSTPAVLCCAVLCLPASLAPCPLSNRHTLQTIFSKDEAVQQLVLSAALPAAVMLGLGWNNSLEGCLLAADDQPFVVRMYPCAVAAALLQLGWGYWAGSGLPGVWMALMVYYLVLLIGFAGRYWIFRGKL